MRDRKHEATTALLGAIAHQLGRLLTNELLLAREELLAKRRGLTLTLLCALAAIALGLFGAIALLITSIVILHLVMPLWAAALVNAAVLLTLAACLALAAKVLLAGILPLTPTRALASFQQELKWLTAQATSNNE